MPMGLDKCASNIYMNNVYFVHGYAGQKIAVVFLDDDTHI